MVHITVVEVEEDSDDQATDTTLAIQHLEVTTIQIVLDAIAAVVVAIVQLVVVLHFEAIEFLPILHFEAIATIEFLSIVHLK